MTTNPRSDKPIPSLLVPACLGTELFTTDDQPNKIKAVWCPGATPLVVVVGPNACGKSLFRRVAGQFTRQEWGAEYISISMEQRRHGLFERAFIYGDEMFYATGYNSAMTILKGIVTCRSREAPVVIFWDEPDLGLSDEYAAGAGQTLAEFAFNPGEHTCAAFVVSHNRHLLRELIPLKPNYLCLGSCDFPSLQSWVEREVRPAKIEGLRDRGRATFHMLRPYIKRG